MKKIFLILCVILPFFLACPLNALAFDVQGTEYEDPGLLPPDIDFSQYDYYFLAFSGTAENPTYLLYLINDNSDEKQNRIYFSVLLQPSSTKIYDSEYTSYGITSNYSVTIRTYNNSSGSWGSLKVSSSSLSGFVFDSYSEFTSSYKYIIGSNANIYSYSGSLLRSGDYDDLNLFFLGGLYNSSEVTENSTEITTGGSDDDDGSIINIDFSFLTDYFDTLFGFFESLLNNFTSVLTNITSIADVFNSLITGNDFSDITGQLEEIENYLSNFIRNYPSDLENSLSPLLNKLDEIKTEILNFERYFSEFSAVNGEIANIFSVLSGLNSNIVNIHVRLLEIKEIISGISDDVSDIRTRIYNFLLNFPTDFSDIINSINNNIADIRTRLYNFFLNFPTDFDDTINSINDHLANLRTDFHNFLVNFSADSLFDDILDCLKRIIDVGQNMYSEITSCLSQLNNISYYSKWINENIKTVIDTLTDFGNALFVSHFPAIETVLSDILNSFENFKSYFDTYAKGMAENIVSINNFLSSLPDDIANLLGELFIPKTEKPLEIMGIIEEKFGFVSQIAEMSDAIFNENNFSNEVPEYTFSIDSETFGHFEGTIIDFSVIPYDYIIWFKCLVSGITCYFFIQKVRKRLPAIINGEASL